MRTFVVVSCLLAVAVAQFPPAQPAGLKEARHFQAISQPHLPQDTNVLHATRQFLDKFAQLKALADAAPDPVPQGQVRQQFAPAPQQQQFAQAPHRFAAPQQAARPAPRPAAPHGAIKEFDVNAEIGSLLAKHHAANPTPAPAPRRPQPVQAQRAPAFPTFNLQNNLAGHRPQARPQPQPQPQPQRPQFVQAAVQQVDPNVQTHNNQGLLINPKRFPGPLAHEVPAGLTGRVEHTQFTPEVAAAHRALASAHANILQKQAGLPRPQ